MSKKIEVKNLSCISTAELVKIFVGKKIVGVSQVGGGDLPTSPITDFTLALQDENGNTFALIIQPYDDELYDSILEMKLTPYTDDLNDPFLAFYDEQNGQFELKPYKEVIEFKTKKKSC